MTPQTPAHAPPPWFANPAAPSWVGETAPVDVGPFHAGLPGYRPTPLVEIPAVAAELGVGRLLVKDESTRLGLPSFKVLGASWAVARLLQRRADGPAGVPTVDDLRAMARAVAPLELVTATDGNHGRAVARMAATLGLGARVYVPDVIPPAAVDAIRTEGALVEAVAGHYDEAVQAAVRHAEAHPDAVLVQDMGWPGYVDVPGWIVEGYDTLFTEVDRQVAAQVGAPAALVVVPVGVGSLAQAAVRHHRSVRHPGRTAVLGVEPDTAACVLASLTAGSVQTIEAGRTVMAGLNCGTPSSLAWPDLAGGLDAAVAVGDEAAVRAAEDLAAAAVDAGYCGGASLAGARAVLTGPGSDERRAHLGVGADSTVVLLSTDGRDAAQEGDRS